MKLTFVGGPLDGLSEDIAVNEEEPFLVFELTTCEGLSTKLRRPGLFSMYNLQDGQLVFVETRNWEQLCQERGERD